MSLNSKKISKPTEIEDIIPVGFSMCDKTHSIFCRTKESPEKIYITSSEKNDFINFSKNKREVVFKNRFLQKKLKPENIDNIIYSINDENGKKNEIITFTNKDDKENHLYFASAKDKDKWLVQGPVLSIKERGGIISNYINEGNRFLYCGESSLYVLSTQDFRKWKGDANPILKPRPGFFDKDGIKFIDSKVTETGILVFYDSSIKDGQNIKIQIGIAMFSLANPSKIIWRTDEPIYTDKVPYKKDFTCKGIIFTDDRLAVYWYSKSMGILSTTLPLPFSSKLKMIGINKLNKHRENPIISPDQSKGKEWMNEGVFNPAAIVLNNKVHLLFRAVGNDGVSRVGYSSSYDGLNFDRINLNPVFHLSKSRFGGSSDSSFDKIEAEKLKSKDENGRYDPVMYPSGGSWGGCEDPRLVQVGDRIYMTFNAFDGWDFVRVGYTSIKETDFEKGIWNWEKPELISPVGQINKNWVIFPEKINGKFAILHSLTPEVQVDYVDKLEDLSSGRRVIKSKFERPKPRSRWDTWVRGAGPSPIKTDDGWLVFYHAISADEPTRYKLGVMLLDLKNPRQILARASSPILLPDMWYENESKPGIVYACGAVIKDGTLFVYYGGGDKFVCVATIPFIDFMNDLKNITERVPLISKVIFS